MGDVLNKLQEIAEELYEQMEKGKIPFMKIPTRTKDNIKFNMKHGVWKYGKNVTVRDAKKLDGAYMILRTMYMLDFIRDMIGQNKSSTLREMYYISEG